MDRHSEITFSITKYKQREEYVRYFSGNPFCLASVSDRPPIRYSILKNKNLSIPPGTSPCCPPAVDSENPVLNTEQSPLGSDFADSLERNDQTEFDFSALAEISYSDMDPFGLSFTQTDQLPLHSPIASFSGTAFDSASQAPDGDSPAHTPQHDLGNWKIGASGPETNITASRLAEERQQLLSSHGLTLKEVESQLALFTQLRRGPDRYEHHADVGPADAFIPGELSSHTSRSRRTTITIDDIAPETLVEVMQVLINAKAKVRFETE